MLHNRLESYLDEIETHLQSLPEWERIEWREEARQHLAALAEAHEELGAEPEAAVRAAIKQFGVPETLGRQVCATSSQAIADRRTSNLVGWSLHSLSYNTLVTMGALSLLMDPRPLAHWAALAVLLAGHTTGGALFGWQTGRARFIWMVTVPYIVLVTAGALLTGWPASVPPSVIAVTTVATAAALPLGALGAGLGSLVSRRRTA
jgi:hypothetical protein